MTRARGRLVRTCTPLTFLAIACSAPAPPPQPQSPSPRIAVEKTFAGTDAHYSAARGDCRIRWEVRGVEPGVILQRSACSLPLSEQAPILLALWKVLPPMGESKLFWGRICPDTGCAERQISRRLALAAHHAPDWDARAGRPASGHENGWVRDAVSLTELREAFLREGIELSVAGVEKVLVARAGDLPYAAELQHAGVAADEKLPYDALLWLKLSGP